MEAGKYAHKIHYAFMLKRCGRYAATNVVMNQWDPTSFVGHSWLELYALKGTHIQCMHTDATLTSAPRQCNGFAAVFLWVMQGRGLTFSSTNTATINYGKPLKSCLFVLYEYLNTCSAINIYFDTHIHPHYYLVQRAATGQYTAEHSNTTAVKLHMKNLL